MLRLRRRRPWASALCIALRFAVETPAPATALVLNRPPARAPQRRTRTASGRPELRAAEAADEDSDSRRERWTSEWETVVQALETYRVIHGDLRVPTRFVVPTADAAWPEDLFDLKLGMRVAAIRSTGRYVAGNDARRRLLDGMGFEWRLRASAQVRAAEYELFDEPYETVYEALRTYKDVHDDLAMDDKFVVPYGPPWAQACFGLPLGARVKALQRAEKAHPYLDEARLSPERVAQRVRELDELGFDWSATPTAAAAGPRKKRGEAAAARFEVVFEALAAFKQLQGHLDVPQQFVVPADMAWPREAWRMRLGSRVNGIRQHDTFVKDHDDRRDRLVALGLALGAKSGADAAKSSLAKRAAMRESAGEASWAEDGEYDDEDEDFIDAAVMADRALRERRRTVPVNADFTDETIVSRAELVSMVARGWVFDEFGGGFDFEDVIRALKEYHFNYGEISTMPRTLIVPDASYAGEDDFDEIDAVDEAVADDDDVDAALAAFLSSTSEEDEDEPSVAELRLLEGGGGEARLLDLDDDDEAYDDDYEDEADAIEAAPPAPKANALPALVHGGPRAVWSPDLAGLALGRAVDSMRIGDVSAWEDLDRRAALDAVEFPWGDPDCHVRGVHWEQFLSALFSFSKVKGTLAVKWDFVIPFEEPWPLPHQGHRIGEWVNHVRDQVGTLARFYPERKRQLDHMGFVWLPAIFEAPPVEYDERLPPALRLDNDELEDAYGGGGARKRRKSAAASAGGGALPDLGTNYGSYTVAQLKELLRRRKLPVTGRVKQDYVERLREQDLKLGGAPPFQEDEPDEEAQDDDSGAQTEEEEAPEER
ncbi:hypothetical protein M885DRAFT_514545 [Pelagophyceae sp. CCMP2097]|nr:hypothetical protein M885DRAFT_514545 [Pelagophyceae sp. CCMP2097]